MKVTFDKKYRSKNQKSQVAIIASYRTRRQKKQEILKFLALHFPDSRCKVRLLNQYKKGCIAIISTKDQKAIWQ